MDTRRKLAVLADAARFDAPCARRVGPDRPGASTHAALPVIEPLDHPEDLGICYAIAADGRRVALLKVLLTNHCIHDCGYCVNRRSADVERARFTVEEIVRLVLERHRQGAIDGLFLSSGVMRSADYTMEQMNGVARSLRRDHAFDGYIHLKAIPEASPELIEEAGRWADRLSVNVELPTQQHLDALAPGRRLVTIARAMGRIRDGIAESEDAQRRYVRAPAFAPAGQVTQMVVGADDSSDRQILSVATTLYDRQRLRRVYYGTYVPIAGGPDAAPTAVDGISLAREHRLYQADWLLRQYGFALPELVPDDQPNLALDMDPKLAWALRRRDQFPVDLNRASRQELLRVPGLGRTSVDALLRLRRTRRVRTSDLVPLRVPLARTLPFIVAADENPALRLLDSATLRDRLAPKHAQLDLFRAAS